MADKNIQKINDEMIGTIYAVIAFTLWGLLPLYWKMLNEIPAGQILAHRILWSFVFVFTILIFQKRIDTVKRTFSHSKFLTGIILSTIFISINWFMYIWAVTSNHVVEASMGYYINPLVVVILGIVVLKERLNLWQLISLILASTGVLILTLQYGKIPWIALGLAVSFALYGLFKKLVNVESIVGLGLETLILTPIMLIYLIYKEINGTGVLGHISITTTILLLCSGIVTASPLILFAKAASKVPLSTIGFTQYISPTISLFLGIFIFKEHFTKIHLISFCFIWSGLIIYTLSQTKILKEVDVKFIKNLKNNV